MNHTDLFVGSVAMGLGLLAIVAAASNWNACYQLDKVRWLEDQWGRSTLRWVYALVGLILFVLGIAIAAGLGPNVSASSTRSHQAKGMLSRWSFDSFV